MSRNLPGPKACSSALGILIALAGASAAASAPQSDAGSILIVQADDLGIDALAMYGLDPAVPPGLTPNLDTLASLGVRFVNAWGAPKCSPGRAALQTGRISFRTGIGNVIEAGTYSLSPSEVVLPEMLSTFAPVPYASGFFGKWHLERNGTNQLCGPSALHGYQHFAGTLLQVPSLPGYCSWRERVCNGSEGTSQTILEYMPAHIVDQAAEWIAAQSGPWLCTLAVQSPYEIGHVPPQDLQSARSGASCSPCSSSERACYDAALQAFDTKLGELLSGLGPDWFERITVIFTADNGTPGAVNRYWPAGRAKLTLFEGGVRVPFVIAGRGVDPTRRGSVASDLVALTDVYRTVATLAGVSALPPELAQDSFDLTPLLAQPPLPSGRTHLLAETFGKNQPAPPYLSHKIAVRDTRYKLVYQWTERRPLQLFDLASDPRELRNLLAPTIPPPSTPAGAALAALVAHIHATLGL
jgi:arylsulfatase A-like enzyme